MTPIRILILVVLIGITACNTSGKKNQQFKNKDTTAASIPPIVQADRSRFVLDTTIVSGFAGDTAGQINKTLELIRTLIKHP